MREREKKKTVTREKKVINRERKTAYDRETQ